VPGIGKSEKAILSREVLMCSERYADDIPFLFLKTQFPPTRSDASIQSNGMPSCEKTLAVAIPLAPAPMRKLWEIGDQQPWTCEMAQRKK
jgi:hypothetical protein